MNFLKVIIYVFIMSTHSSIDDVLTHDDKLYIVRKAKEKSSPEYGIRQFICDKKRIPLGENGLRLHRHTVRRWLKNFETTGSIYLKKIPQRQRPVSGEDSIIQKHTLTDNQKEELIESCIRLKVSSKLKRILESGHIYQRYIIFKTSYS